MNAGTEIQKILTGAMARLKSQNDLISLRALAARMDVSPSYLSKLMTGKKAIPLKFIPTLQAALHLDTMETNSLQRYVLEHLEEKEATPVTGIKSLRSEDVDLSEYAHFTQKDFLLLDKWYYIPLLNLVTTEDFCGDADWISARLNLPVSDVRVAIRELIAEGYLENTNGTLQVTAKKVRFPTDKSHAQIREYHRKMIKKATEVLSTKLQPEDFQNRLINCVSFAGSAEKIEEAKVILNHALYQVAELLSKGPADEVFQINLQFFKLTEELADDPKKSTVN